MILIGLAIIDKKLRSVVNFKTESVNAPKVLLPDCKGLIFKYRKVQLSMFCTKCVMILSIVLALQHLEDSVAMHKIHFVNAYFKTANEHELGVLCEKADDHSSV